MKEKATTFSAGVRWENISPNFMCILVLKSVSPFHDLNAEILT